MLPDRLAGIPRLTWAVSLSAGVLVLLVSAGVWTQLDLDGDGLDAAAELSVGTDPLRADTDRDGLDDGFERAHQLDPFHIDTDRDRRTDRQELTAGTDPRQADTDGDGLSDLVETQGPTDPTVSDTDGDGLTDGHEAEIGTDPVNPDTDRDGLDDAAELLDGFDPHAADSDGDGLTDVEEHRSGLTDCDGDGFHAGIDSDDDNDLRPDGDEPATHRCEPDVDGDGILDGAEGSEVCIERVDCDADGLEDSVEHGTAFDRLDPDTFDVGLLDSVTWAFEQRGQPPSRDTDRDGIPDRWEQTTGLIEWGPFDPAPQRADMMVEFVRVEGPDSSRLGPGAFTEVYQRITRFFRDEGDVRFDWVETTVELDAESRPPLIPSSGTDYYETVLAASEHAGNPYVTTVVLNPQHDASEIAHLGVAPIRGMLGAIDYGAHSQVHFQAGGQPFSLSPFLESVVVADRQDILQAKGYTDGGRTADGRLFVTTTDWRMTWRPFWFASPPRFTFNDGGQLNASRETVSIDEDELADTIAHELGHTLGLCHLTLPDCRANLSAADRETVGVSTMDPRRSDARLEFLPSEWEQLRTYLACPPQKPIRLIAEGASNASVIDAKYAVTLETVLDVRVRDCQDRHPIPGDLTPVVEETRYEASHTVSQEQIQQAPTTYEAPADETPPPALASRSTEATQDYAWGSLVAAVATAGITGVLVARWPS